MKKGMVVLTLMISTLILGCQNGVEETDVESEYLYEDEYSDETEVNYEEHVNEPVVGCRGINNVFEFSPINWVSNDVVFEVVEILEFETECGALAQIEISRSDEDEQRTCIELHCPFHGEDQDSLVWVARHTTPHPPQNFYIHSRESAFGEGQIRNLYFRHSIFSDPENIDPYSFDHVFGIDCDPYGGWLSTHRLGATSMFTNGSGRPPGVIASNVFSRRYGVIDFGAFHYPYSLYGFVRFTDDYQVEVYEVETGIMETFFPQESSAVLPPPWQTFIGYRDLSNNGHRDLYISTFPQIEGWGAVARVHLIYIWDLELEDFVEVEFVGFETLQCRMPNCFEYEDEYMVNVFVDRETSNAYFQTFRWEGNRLILVSQEPLPDDFW